MDVKNNVASETNVGIIDSGIDRDVLQSISYKDGVHILQKENQEIICDDEIDDVIGHGSACALIISKISPNANIFIIKVFEEELCTNIDILIHAIEWCVKNNIHIINLSLGTTREGDKVKLKSVCDYAYENNVIVIAAENNIGNKSYPAHFENVIGVAAGKIRNERTFYHCPESRVEFVAKGDLKKIEGPGKREYLTQGTSFATPRIVGLASLVFEKFPMANTDYVRSKLIEQSKSGQVEHAVHLDNSFVKKARSALKLCHVQSEGGYRYDWIKKAYISNSAIPTILEINDFKNLFPFTLTNARTINEAKAQKAKSSKREDKNVLASQLKGCDTLITGKSWLDGGLDYTSLIAEIEFALEQGKNIYSFTPLSGDQFREVNRLAKEKNRIVAYSQLTYRDYLEITHFAKDIESASVPVVCLMSTPSATYNKFLLELYLKKLFTQIDYKVRQVGSTGIADLLEFDFVLPITSENGLGIQIPVENYIDLLRSVMRILSCLRTELIIAGAPASPINVNLSMGSCLVSLKSLAFLYGVNPDIIIFVCSTSDDKSFIERNLSAIQNISKDTAITIIDNADDGISNDTNRVISEQMGIPIISLGTAASYEKLIFNILKNLS